MREITIRDSERVLVFIEDESGNSEGFGFTGAMIQCALREYNSTHFRQMSSIRLDMLDGQSEGSEKLFNS